MFRLTTSHHFSAELQNLFPSINFANLESLSKRTIISNTQEECDIFAPEINWYLSNSLSNDDQIKLNNIHRFFQNRMSIYNHSPFKEYQVKVDKDLLLLGLDTPLVQDFFQEAQKAGFATTILNPQEILHISGELGSFVATLHDKQQISFSQAVLFIKEENLCKFLGIISIQDFCSSLEVLALLKSRLGIYTYKTTTLYNPHICQYHHRRPNSDGEGYCHKCVNVCPTFGVTKDDSLMELIFSQIDCMGCGGCIATCPSGALDFAPYTIDCLIESLHFYKNTQILLIPENFLHLLEDVKIPQHISPLIIPREKFLSEVHLLAIAQESGNSFIFYSPIISRPSLEAIKLINDIYEAICKKKAIFVAQELETLQTLWDKPSALPQYSYIPSPKEARRKHFGERLRYLIKDGDFGTVESGASAEMICYGKIHINESKCTLCNSCVGACNVDSLTANPHKLALQYNPSLCTTCGYCISSCPEDALNLELSGIELNPTWFETHTLAKDELFACIECGKPFATTKSIEKIKAVMNSHFLSDNAKLKSLECCADCKVKIMFENI